MMTAPTWRRTHLLRRARLVAISIHVDSHDGLGICLISLSLRVVPEHSHARLDDPDLGVVLTPRVGFVEEVDRDVLDRVPLVCVKDSETLELGAGLARL